MAELNLTYVNSDELKEHPQNPRVGNVELIAESLKRNGQYRPLIVSRTTMHVVAGNHTLKAIKRLSAEDPQWGEGIPVILLDLDEEGEKRILTVDNRSADLGTYEDEALLALLLELTGDLDGTGYTQDDVDDLEFLTRGAASVAAPITDAHYNESPEQQAEREERVGGYQPMRAQGIAELVLVLPSAKKDQLVGWLDRLRTQWGPEMTNGEIVHAAIARLAETP